MLTFIIVNDFNNDSKMNVAVSSKNNENIGILYGYGNGTFGNKTSYAMGYNFNIYAVALADFNGDGLIDITIANYRGDFVDVLLQTC